MALPPLVIEVNSIEDLYAWSLSHSLDHEEIDSALIAQGKLSSPLKIPLDPLPSADGMANWLLWHQLKHTEMDDALGVATSDLANFDFSTKEGLAAFIGSNFSEHVDAHAALGI